MADVNYFVLHANGDVGAIHIGEADDDEIFEILLKVFKTGSPCLDNYECSTMCTFSADDVSLVADSDSANVVVRNFREKLAGFGFELFACWHIHGKALHQLGVYEKNRFLSGHDIYGPIVIRAQLLRNDIAVEVPVSTALYVTGMIVNAKGDSIDSIFRLQPQPVEW